jgi:hypothetical protein
MSLRVSTVALEGVYQASKYLKYQVLCDAQELKDLFFRLGSFKIYPLTGVVDGNPIEQETFLLAYENWIEKLKQGQVPSSEDLRSVLACAFTEETEALWKLQVPGGKYLVKMNAPVVQVQAHFFTYSTVDEVFRPMTMGLNSIFWGLQFSFPQIYQDPKTMALLEVEKGPNFYLFQNIKQWVRDATRPTPFVVEGKKTNATIRLGKNCFPWICRHPELIQQGIAVYAK